MDELSLLLRRRSGSGVPDGPDGARVETVVLRGRRRLVLVLPESVASALGLAEGDEFALRDGTSQPWTMEFKYALDEVARYLRTSRDDLTSRHPVGLLNSREGEREFLRRCTSTPDLPIPTCRRGIVVRAGRMDFVYLHPDVWESGRNVVPTSIHMLFHVFQPSLTEDDVRRTEEDLCESLERGDAGHEARLKR